MQIYHFDIKKNLDWLWENKIRICILSLSFMLCFYMISVLFVKPVYRTEFTVFVDNKSPGMRTEQITNADTAAAQFLTQTYAEILKNRDLINRVIRESGVQDSDMQNLSVNTDVYKGTQLINVTVDAESPDAGYRFADVFSKIASEYVEAIIDGTSMTVVTSPVKQTEPFWPDHKKHAAIGFVFGFAFSCLFAVIKVLLKKQIDSGDELVELYGFPVLGRIPFVED